METNVLIILIAAVFIVILITLFLNRGRLKRLGIKAGTKGFEVDVKMEDPGHNEKPESKKKAVVEKIQQKGNRDEIQIHAEDVKARNIKQDGDDNKINIG